MLKWHQVRQDDLSIVLIPLYKCCFYETVTLFDVTPCCCSPVKLAGTHSPSPAPERRRGDVIDLSAGDDNDDAPPSASRGTGGRGLFGSPGGSQLGSPAKKAMSAKATAEEEKKKKV